MLKNNFFDRQEYINLLKKRVNDLVVGYRQNLALIGEEGIGKTSIIFHFLRNFYDNRLVFVYLEIRPETLESFIKRFIGVLLYNFLMNSSKELKEDLELLVKKASIYIPQTTLKINNILNNLNKNKRKSELFKETLMLTEILYRETSKHCVVIFDEFHHLETLKNKNIYNEWAKVLVEQKNTLYIIISSMKLKAKIILDKYLSLLFGNFETVIVETFDIPTTEKYLLERLSSISINPAYKNFIIHFTGGHPFYLEVITETLLKKKDLNLIEALEELFFSPSGVLNQRFTNYLNRITEISHSNEYLSILYLVSTGYNKIKDIAYHLHKTQKEIKQRIDRLIEREVLSRNGDFLSFNDRVFSFWLKFVHQEKLISLTFDAKNQKEAFRKRIEEMLQKFLIEEQKPVIKRMIELLHNFQGETVHLNRKKFIFERFREIKSLEFNSQNFKDGILGRSRDSLWIIGFKYGHLTEEDIIDFNRECKKYRHKRERKIIITLEQNVDTNARLRAMEEKIFIWDLNSLNQIMDLFYCSRIII